MKNQRRKSLEILNLQKDKPDSPFGIIIPKKRRLNGKDILRLHSQLISKFISGEINSQAAKDLSMLTSNHLTIIKAVEFEARIAELEIRGIYAKVRHPLYLAVLFLLGGLILIYPFPEIFVFATTFCAYVLIGAYLEERKLVLQYGQKYLDYQKQVGFMIPKR